MIILFMKKILVQIMEILVNNKTKIIYGGNSAEILGLKHRMILKLKKNMFYKILENTALNHICPYKIPIDFIWDVKSINRHDRFFFYI